MKKLIKWFKGLFKKEPKWTIHPRLLKTHLEARYQFSKRGLSLPSFNLKLSDTLKANGMTSGKTIFINSNLEDWQREVVLFHECGHLLGLEHDSCQIMRSGKIAMTPYKFFKDQMLDEYFKLLK